ncbi:MAG: tyrosine--tRNA ligase [Planctomycetes bacterium]|nr:tyrosine--tRNA ligase [Planctomycetota bacterium]
MNNISQQAGIIKNNCVHLEKADELAERLSKKPKLRIKFGMDPTAPDIHLGHLVLINKINDFLKLGHEVIIIIGDFTSMVGDPTGRSKTRPRLSQQDVDNNAKTYFSQLKKVLVDGNIVLKRNSEWINKLTIDKLITYLSKFTIARLLERDDFSIRYKNGEPIFLHELMYIFLQAYDSVILQPDIEIGGTDQLFNFLAARELMRDVGLEPQICFTMPLLVGLDGKQKMSKSLGNYVGITEDPFSIFSKIMSIPDSLMDNYFKLILLCTDNEISNIKTQCSNNPRDVKLVLAQRITAKLSDENNADDSKNRWINTFSKKEYSHIEETIKIAKNQLKNNSKMWIVDLVFRTNAFKSKGEARRVIEQGGVEINQNKLTDTKSDIEVTDGMIIKIGKKNKLYQINISD